MEREGSQMNQGSPPKFKTKISRNAGPRVRTGLDEDPSKRINYARIGKLDAIKFKLQVDLKKLLLLVEHSELM